MKVRAFITHKLSERYADCQDRLSINVDRRTVAVSDGMSQSIFPEKWAEFLATQYVNTGHCTDEDRKALSKEWVKSVRAARQQQIDSGKNTWMLDNMLAEKRGAGATICGVTFENATDWQGDVLGDSCIIEIDKQEGTAKVLSSEEKAFDSYPDFYDSYADKTGRGTIKHFSGSIGEEKLLLLASDPFSEFFQKSQDDCKVLIEQILELYSHEDFCALVDNWREAGMHNDDSTLCIMEFDNDINMNVEHEDKIQDLINSEQITKPEVEERSIEETSAIEGNKDERAEGFQQVEVLKEEQIVNHNNKLSDFFDKVMSVFVNLITKASPQSFSSRGPNEAIKEIDVKNAKTEIEKYYQSIKED